MRSHAKQRGLRNGNFVVFFSVLRRSPNFSFAGRKARALLQEVTLLIFPFYTRKEFEHKRLPKHNGVTSLPLRSELAQAIVILTVHLERQYCLLGFPIALSDFARSRRGVRQDASEES
jgi:hypothetical protein